MRPAISDRRQATGDKAGWWSGLVRYLGKGNREREPYEQSTSVIGRLEYGALAWAAGGKKKGQDVPAEEFSSNLPST